MNVHWTGYWLSYELDTIWINKLSGSKMAQIVLTVPLNYKTDMKADANAEADNGRRGYSYGFS